MEDWAGVWGQHRKQAACRVTPETVFWELLAGMVLPHRLGALRTDRVSSPFLHSYGLRIRDVNVIWELGVMQILRPRSRHAESESVL